MGVKNVRKFTCDGCGAVVYGDTAKEQGWVFPYRGADPLEMDVSVKTPGGIGTVLLEEGDAFCTISCAANAIVKRAAGTYVGFKE